MNTNTDQTATKETFYEYHHKIVCWKSIVSGLFIAIMSYMLLSALGAGIGGLTAVHLIDNEKNGSGLGTGAGLWLGISAVVSLFLGAYFSQRISNFVTKKVGVINGLILGSVFFILMIWGAGHSIGGMSKGLGSLAGNLATSTATVAMDPSVQDTIEKSMGNSNLKSEPGEVIQGIAVRLLQGDTESAKRYYAYETGTSQSDAEAKVNQLKAEFDQNAKIAAEKSAQAIADAGWSLFVMFVVGLGAAVVGGIEGAKGNRERPIARFHSNIDTKKIQPII